MMLQLYINSCAPYAPLETHLVKSCTQHCPSQELTLWSCGELWVLLLLLLPEHIQVRDGQGPWEIPISAAGFAPALQVLVSPELASAGLAKACAVNIRDFVSFECCNTWILCFLCLKRS